MTFLVNVVIPHTGEWLSTVVGSSAEPHPFQVKPSIELLLDAEPNNRISFVDIKQAHSWIACYNETLRSVAACRLCNKEDLCVDDTDKVRLAVDAVLDMKRDWGCSRVPVTLLRWVVNMEQLYFFDKSAIVLTRDPVRASAFRFAFRNLSEAGEWFQDLRGVCKLVLEHPDPLEVSAKVWSEANIRSENGELVLLCLSRLHIFRKKWGDCRVPPSIMDWVRLIERMYKLVPVPDLDFEYDPILKVTSSVIDLSPILSSLDDEN